MNTSFTLLKFALMAMFGLFTLTACNTVEGMGEDVSAAGNAVDQEAEENTSY